MFRSSPPLGLTASTRLDFSDHGYLVSRLFRRAAGQIRAIRQPATMATLAWLSQPVNQSRIVFIVGAARSGTVALQTALNTSSEVFVLGEAYFFWENFRSGFRSRYNTKHRELGYPPTKQNECPAVAPQHGTWVETLAGLAAQYRLVGDKIAFGGYKEGRWPSEFLAFHSRHFPQAAYILAFRNPYDAILSPRQSWGIENLVPWARSYIAAQRALLRLRLNFPRTVPVFLETIGPETFKAIEQCLECPTPRLASVLMQKQASPHDSERIPPQLRQTISELDALYPTVCDAVARFDRSQPGSLFDPIDARLAQIYHRLDPLYYSIGARLGRLRSRLITASRMTRNLVRQHVYR
jgi:hypothetical protein